MRPTLAFGLLILGSLAATFATTGTIAGVAAAASCPTGSECVAVTASPYGNGTGELIVLLSTILDLGVDPAGEDGARADELAVAYHERWEQETGNDQLKTHLRGPGRVLRSRLPDLVHQEIWAYLIVLDRRVRGLEAARDLEEGR